MAADDQRDAVGFVTVGVLSIAARVIGSAALLDAGGLLLWREWVFNPTCARTPMGEISGNPLLQELLVPSVFLIRAVSILDAGLKGFIAAGSLLVPSRYRDDLNGRICFLVDVGVLTDATPLHTIRLRRNDLAHEDTDAIGWDIFDSDVAVIETTLTTLGRREEVDIVRRFRKTAAALQDPAHGKYYLNRRTFVPAVAAQFSVEQAAMGLIVAGVVCPVAVPRLLRAWRELRELLPRDDRLTSRPSPP